MGLIVFVWDSSSLPVSRWQCVCVYVSICILIIIIIIIIIVIIVIMIARISHEVFFHSVSILR